MTARLALVALGLVAALGLAEGMVRLAARLDPGVRLLATGRASRPAVAHRTLEAFLAAQATHVTPHGQWYNHWSNAFGFHDEEFVEPKPPGRFRILAIGDSFTFAPVPYPQGVMTLTEAGLRAACGGRDLDLLNMGLMGAGPPEYRILAELAVPRFRPDLVLVDIFVGNDAPDLHRHVHDRSPAEHFLRRSYLWTFVKNLVRTRSGLRDTLLPGRVRPPLTTGEAAPGGTPVDPARPLAADDPALVGPLLSQAAYEEVLAYDLARLYRPPEERDLHAAWRPLLADLDALRGLAARAGAQVVLVVFPSVLQVDAALRRHTVARAGGTLRYRGLSDAHVDPGLPNAMLAAYARARDLPLLDLTPVFVAEERVAAPEPLYKRQDNHWTPRGNRVAARALRESLAPLVCSR
jgi:hypothetical protein